MIPKLWCVKKLDNAKVVMLTLGVAYKGRMTVNLGSQVVSLLSLIYRRTRCWEFDEAIFEAVMPAT